MKINFLGLVCFVKEEGGGRLALMPDGRSPGRLIDPHFPQLIVAADAVTGGEGWDGDVTLSGDLLNFTLPLCTLTIDGVAPNDGSAGLDTSFHTVPLLTDIDEKFEIDPNTANAVVRLRIRRGSLRAFRSVGASPENAAVVSQLEVAPNGPITITVQQPGDHLPQTITLRPDTEIIIANASRPGESDSRNIRSHALIYERLATRKVNLAGAEERLIPPATLPELPSTHKFFQIPGIIGSGPACGNTGWPP